MDAPLRHLFVDAAATQGDKPAIVGAGRTLSFRGLADAAEDEASRWAERRGPARPPCDDKVTFLIGFFAALISGRPAFVAPAHETLPPHAAEPGEFYWGVTSGSTGEPKVFARTQRSWVESFAACEAVFPFRGDDVIGLPGALTHSLFLYGAVHALARGLTVLAPNGYAPRAFARTMRDHRTTVLYAAPAMLADFAAAGAAPLLRLIFCGGASLDDATRTAAERAFPGADVISFYGASELSFVSYAATSAPAPKGSAGRLFPGVEAEARGGDGAALPSGRTGVIHVRSPMLFSRYLGEPPVGDGAFVTAGDTGFFDAAGFLHLTGRADRELNLAGVKVAPERVEAALLAHPMVTRAAAVGVAQRARGALLTAVVEAEPGLTAADLRAHCRDRLPPTWRPRHYYRAARLPLTHSGKIAFDAVGRDLAAGVYEPLP